MPWTVTEFEPTPNPNAVKCILDAPISDRPRSFLNRDAATGDELAERLFAIPGVTTLLMNGGWMTVNKSTDAEWPAIKRAVRRVLAETP
jgi:hypothetical protein